MTPRQRTRRSQVYTLKAVVGISYYVNANDELVFGYALKHDGNSYSRMGYATLKQAMNARAAKWDLLKNAQTAGSE